MRIDPRRFVLPAFVGFIVLMGLCNVPCFGDSEFLNVAPSAKVTLTTGDPETVAHTDKLTNEQVDPTSAETLTGIPVQVELVLPTPETVNRMRLFPGNPMYAGNASGDCGIRDYYIEGFVEGRWRLLGPRHQNARTFLEMDARGMADYVYDHRFDPVQTDRVRLTITQSADTGLRQDTTVPLEPEKRIVILREIELYSAETKVELKAIPLNRRLQAEFVLPAYLNKEQAELFIRPTALNDPVTLEVAFRERFTQRVPADPLTLTVFPHQDKTVVVPIASWPDGDYLTEISEVKSAFQKDAGLVRVVRKQTLLSPPSPKEPIHVSNITMLFLDDYHIEDKAGLTVKPYQAEQRPVVIGPIEGRYRNLNATRIWHDDDGTVNVFIQAATLDGQDKQNFIATSDDYHKWTVRPETPVIEPKIVRRNSADIDPDDQITAAANPSPDTGPVYRFYDEAKDGDVPLDRVRMRYSGYADTQWGQVPIQGRSWYPVWQKNDKAFVILRNEPLITDSGNFPDGAFGDWNEGNDNFGGQWYSPDGQTLFFSYARLVPRHDPFRIPYDNLYSGSRIMVVWRTQDGFEWEPSFLNLPTEDDPVGYQHYGVITWPAERGRLRLALLLSYDAKTQQLYRRFMHSRDSLLWHLMPGPAFAENGPFDSWNFGYVSTNRAHVTRDGTTYILMHRTNNRVHFWYDMIDRRADKPLSADVIRAKYEHRRLTEWPYWDRLGSWEALSEHIGRQSHSVGLMVIREDGYASLSSDKHNGALVTKVLEVNRPAALAINARTRPGGAIRVEVLDESGHAVDDYYGRNAAVFKGDDTRHKLQWNNGQTDRIDKDTFRLKITLDRAEIFALHWQ